MDTTLAPTDAAVPVEAPRLPRWLPMTGALFGILSLVADLVIGDFPDGSAAGLAIAGAEFGMGSAMAVLLIGVALAGLLGRAVPRWLAASGLVLGLAHFLPSPWGFFAAMLTLLWFVVAGIALSVRQKR